MSSERDLDLLADGIEKLLEELARVLAGEDQTEIEAILELSALLEIAREAYTMIQARLKNATGASRRRSNRSSHYLQQH
jgi:hypothetical protein